MSFDHVPVQLWMLLPREERNLLAERFDLKKSGITEVIDDRVISDGYNVDDLKGITSEKMVEYVGSEGSFPRLWEITVAKARYELMPPIELKIPTGVIVEKADEVAVIDERDTEPKVDKLTPKAKKHAKSKTEVK